MALPNGSELPIPDLLEMGNYVGGLIGLLMLAQLLGFMLSYLAEGRNKKLELERDKARWVDERTTKEAEARRVAAKEIEVRDAFHGWLEASLLSLEIEQAARPSEGELSSLITELDAAKDIQKSTILSLHKGELAGKERHAELEAVNQQWSMLRNRVKSLETAQA